MNFETLERRAITRVGPPQNQRWHGLDRPSWRSFAVALVALGAALFMALYSGAAAEGGHLLLAGISALAALALAGWVALTIVPVLARRYAAVVAFLPDRLQAHARGHDLPGRSSGRRAGSP